VSSKKPFAATFEDFTLWALLFTFLISVVPYTLFFQEDANAGAVCMSMVNNTCSAYYPCGPVAGGQSRYLELVDYLRDIFLPDFVETLITWLIQPAFVYSVVLLLMATVSFHKTIVASLRTELLQVYLTNRDLKEDLYTAKQITFVAPDDVADACSMKTQLESLRKENARLRGDNMELSTQLKTKADQSMAHTAKEVRIKEIVQTELQKRSKGEIADSITAMWKELNLA